MIIKKITFRHGPAPGAKPVEITPGRITIFIGPNNGGKSSALRDIGNEFIFDRSHEPVVITNIEIARIEEGVARKKISEFHTNEPGQTPERRILMLPGKGRKEVNEQHLLDNLLPRFNEGSLGSQVEKEYLSTYLLSSFALNLTGDSRLNLINPKEGGSLQGPAQTTIASLFHSDNKRRALSEIIHDAFKMHLVIDPTILGTLSYALTEAKPPIQIERSLTDEAIEFFKNTHALSTSSDGTKAFVGVLSEVVAGEVKVLIIDEPEAFLHPGLAHILGRQIALKVSEDKQFFAATHSPHFLMGCLSAGAPVDVIRLTHHAGDGTARLLPATRLSEMMNDPLLRSVGVVSALFYESAIVVEADADRAFYEEINSRIILHSSPGVRHAVFLNAHNKQTASEIVAELRKAGVPSALVLDIDWIKEDGQVCTKYFNAAGIPEGLQSGLRETRRTVRAYLDAASVDYKREGGVALLSGSELSTATSFFNQMEEYGLFTVRSGELESWLPALECNRSKSRWLREIFTALGSDPMSGDYIKPEDDDVWQFLRDIGSWVSNPDKLGMKIDK